MPGNTRNPNVARGVTGVPGQPRLMLGRPLALYRGPRSSPLGATFFIFVSLLAVLSPLAFGVWRSLYAYTTYGLVAADLWGRPWYTISIAALILVVLLTIDRFGRMRRFVAVHTHGLRLRTGTFRTYSLPWTEIAGLSSRITQERFLHLTLRTSHQITLFLKDGEQLRLRGPLENMPELIQMIKAKLYPSRLPELRYAYQSGAWLPFGPLAIQRDGLAMPADREVQIPWEQVNSIQVQAGDLVIQAQGRKAAHIPVSEIPNLELMLDLIQQDPNA